MDSLVFKKITCEDILGFLPFFKLNKNRFCDFTAGTIFMWADFFDNEFAMVDDALIFSGRDMDGLVSFSPPFCQKDNEKEVLAKLFAHAKSTLGYLKLYPIAEGDKERYIELLRQISGKQGTATLMEDWFDYVYSADRLISLSGKKYHGQRNHINRFLRENPDHAIEPIGKDNIEDAMLFAKSLIANTGDKTEAYEGLAVVRTLRHLDKIGQDGLLLKAGGKVAGLVVGEVIGDTLYEHIEKADKTVAGSFPFISNRYIAFMKERYPQIEFVNREEDLGDAGIRYAKECYHPLYKNYKYYIMLKCDIL